MGNGCSSGAGIGDTAASAVKRVGKVMGDTPTSCVLFCSVRGDWEDGGRSIGDSDTSLTLLQSVR